MQTCNGKCQWPARNQQLFILYPEGFVSQHPPDGLSTGIQPHLLQSIMSQCFYATAGCLCLDGLSFPQKTKSSCFAIIYFFEQDVVPSTVVMEVTHQGAQIFSLFQNLILKFSKLFLSRCTTWAYFMTSTSVNISTEKGNSLRLFGDTFVVC